MAGAPFERASRQRQPQWQQVVEQLDGTATELPRGRSYRALISQCWAAMCCCLVDSILRLPRPSSSRPQVNRYRRSWHCLAGLLCCLVALTAAQSAASVIGYLVCTRQLGGCVPFLERDPCLKAAVPFFVVSLVWLSIFCSCCCQSPKALSVFLLVGLCGECVLASYMVAFDQTVRIDDHLRAHLKEALDADCAGRPSPPRDTAAAVRCFRPLHGDIASCRKLAARTPLLCNRTDVRASLPASPRRRQEPQPHPPPPSGLALAFHFDNCIADLLEVIAAKKQLHQGVTYSLLFVFAGFHLVLAGALCGYDVKRKRMEKSLGDGGGGSGIQGKIQGNGQLRQLEIHVNMDARSDQLLHLPSLRPPPTPKPLAALRASSIEKAPVVTSASGQTLPLLVPTGGATRSCGRVTFDMDKRM